MSDEEYGCLDDDDLLHFEAVAVQAEQGPANNTYRPGSPPPTKKPRLNTSHDRGNSLIASRESVMQKNVSGHRDAFGVLQSGAARQKSTQRQSVQRSNGVLNHINPPALQARSRGGNHPPSSSDDIQKQLNDLPSDAFESSSPAFTNNSQNPIPISSGNVPDGLRPSNRGALQGGLRQTTLFNSQPRSNRRPAQPVGEKNEPPTHHKLDEEALATWVYPTNLGTTRDYQYSIVYRGLFHNTLVALPTGLGKTFIAAVVMLNFFRWTKDAQIIFVAPTKPLVSQQVDACFQIAGIPRSETTLLTGDTAPALRAEEWKEKRVFFMTPQTIMNDLKRGYADPKRIVLLVVDEAHRATGAYAYVELVKFIRRFNESFRVLALTATPGSDVESVQKVINGLDISRVEIRTEQSIDIRQYVHSRRVDKEVFKNSEEMDLCMDLFSKAVQPVLNKLMGQNVLFSRDPLSLSPYGCQMARQKWMSSDGGRTASFPLKTMVNSILNVLASLAHSLDLLKFHGIRPFYHGLKHFRTGDADTKQSKHRKEILDSDNFKKLMGTLDIWNSRPDFIGHPKLEYLQSVVLNHFLDAGDGQEGREDSKTRIMVFAHFRDSAEDIVRVLNQSQPMVRPHVFVGQAASKNSEGMDQKRQLEIVRKFKDGKYNTLVATSIGEEGLDIGEVDLIICYDSKASPIRMLQRMGRTGRKRAGKIVLLQMEGKEENDANKAKDNYEKMQELIASGTRFEFHDARSRRIVPKGIIPQVDKRVIEIPIENSQAGLPEPKKRGRKAKVPPKKFHMPDGAVTGFTKASRLHGNEADIDGSEVEPMELEPIPTHDEVALGQLEAQALEMRFQTIGKDEEDVVLPRLNAFPELQRTLRKTSLVKHGELTTALVETVRRIRSIDEYDEIELEANFHLSDLENSDDQNTPGPSPRSTPAPAPAPVSVLPAEPEVESESDLELMPPPPRQVTKATNPRRMTKANSGTKAPAVKKQKKQIRRRAAPETALADEAPPSSSPPPVSSNMRIASQAVSLGDSDTPGEDEDEEEPSSELAAFVAGDSEPVIAESSAFFGSSSFPLSPAASRKGSQRNAGTVVITSDPDCDDDSMDEEILGRSVDRGSKRRVEKPQVPRKRRIVDSDDDDDDDDD